MKKVEIDKIKINPSNPRTIRDDRFAQLVKSIKEFPEMLEKRPIVEGIGYSKEEVNKWINENREAVFARQGEWNRIKPVFDKDIDAN